MSDAEPVDEPADVSHGASRGAAPRLTDDVVAAASGENPYTDLAAVATSAMEAGTEHEDVLQACSAAVLAIRTRADDEIAEDHVLDLTDRLVGWCTKHARL